MLPLYYLNIIYNNDEIISLSLTISIA